MAGKTLGRILGKAAQSRQVASFNDQLEESNLTADEKAALDPYIEVAVRSGSNPKLGLGFVAVLSAFISLAGLFFLGMNVIIGLIGLLIGPILLWYFYNNDYQDMQRANELKQVLATEPRSLLTEETAKKYHDLLDTVDEVPDANRTPLPSDRLDSDPTTMDSSPQDETAAQ